MASLQDKLTCFIEMLPPHIPHVRIHRECVRPVTMAEAENVIPSVPNSIYCSFLLRLKRMKFWIYALYTILAEWLNLFWSACWSAGDGYSDQWRLQGIRWDCSETCQSREVFCLCRPVWQQDGKEGRNGQHHAIQLYTCEFSEPSAISNFRLNTFQKACWLEKCRTTSC